MQFSENDGKLSHACEYWKQLNQLASHKEAVTSKNTASSECDQFQSGPGYRLRFM